MVTHATSNTPVDRVHCPHCLAYYSPKYNHVCPPFLRELITLNRNKVKKTSAEWRELFKQTGEEIIDPDGRDRKDGNFQFSFYEEKITYGEFCNRLIKSTLLIKGSLDRNLSIT